MQQTVPAKKSYRKFEIVLGVIALLVAGYFIYKYTYIYTERRKYDQAEVSIKKVAEDLRKQGINTEFSKGCSRDQAKFDTGALHCSVGIFLNKSLEIQKAKLYIDIFNEVITSSGYDEIDEGINTNALNLYDGMNTYNNSEKDMSCNLVYSTYDLDNKQNTSKIDFYCIKNSRFILFK